MKQNKCSCEFEEAPAYPWKNLRVLVCKELCAYCKAKHEQEKIDREKCRKAQLAQLEPLCCDECGLPFGWVYECDLNGSLFVCFTCKGRQNADHAVKIASEKRTEFLFKESQKKEN